ncbi:hypothetical protein LCGC14_0372510 [marine sediment metagenome]|uniref:HNH domain-containing protein n=1 Tax=marine sediment metagenome TaxID=412755 RepID=A0A0F9T4V4_9ZZZZ
MKTNLQKRQNGSRKSWVEFKGKTIQLDFEPRKGYCSKCGKKDDHTVLHHTAYLEKDPLAYTVELCASCHNKEHSSGKIFPTVDE